MLSSRGFMFIHRIREGALYLFVLVAFGASELLGRALGIRFAVETLGTLYQYLDPSILQDESCEGSITFTRSRLFSTCFSESS